MHNSAPGFANVSFKINLIHSPFHKYQLKEILYLLTTSIREKGKKKGIWGLWKLIFLQPMNKGPDYTTWIGVFVDIILQIWLA